MSYDGVQISHDMLEALKQRLDELRDDHALPIMLEETQKWIDYLEKALSEFGSDGDTDEDEDSDDEGETPNQWWAETERLTSRAQRLEVGPDGRVVSRPANLPNVEPLRDDDDNGETGFGAVIDTIISEGTARATRVSEPPADDGVAGFDAIGQPTAAQPPVMEGRLRSRVGDDSVAGFAPAQE